MAVQIGGRCGRVGLNDPGNPLSQISMQLRMRHNVPAGRNIAVCRIGDEPDVRCIAALSGAVHGLGERLRSRGENGGSSELVGRDGRLVSVG